MVEESLVRVGSGVHGGRLDSSALRQLRIIQYFWMRSYSICSFIPRLLIPELSLELLSQEGAVLPSSMNVHGGQVT